MAARFGNVLYWYGIIVAVLLIVVVAMLPTPTHGETFRANWVEAPDVEVKCIWARDRIVTVVSGPCKNFVPPRQVRVGETFQANGKTKTIGIVTATRMDKDFPQLGLKAGEWTCTAAESPSDIPEFSGKSEHTGSWLYVSKCKPHYSEVIIGSLNLVDCEVLQATEPDGRCTKNSQYSELCSLIDYSRVIPTSCEAWRPILNALSISTGTA